MTFVCVALTALVVMSLVLAQLAIDRHKSLNRDHIQLLESLTELRMALPPEAKISLIEKAPGAYANVSAAVVAHGIRTELGK